MKFRQLLAIVVATGALLSLPAQAQVYIGGAIGNSSFDYDANSLGSALTASGISHTGVIPDTKATGWKAFIGYRINRNFAAELALVELGDFGARTTYTVPNAVLGPITTTVDSDIQVRSGIAASALAIAPFGDLSVFGRLGVHTMNTSISLVNVSASNRSTGLLYGVGAGYDIGRRATIRLEWERYAKVGADEIGEHDADMVSLGALFRF